MKIAERDVDGPDDVLIDLDAEDRPLAERQRGQDVAAPARADDEHPRVRPDVVNNVGDVVLEVLNLREIPAEAGQDGPGSGIDAEAELPDSSVGARIDGAQSPTNRSLEPRVSPLIADSDAREGIPFFVQRSRVFERLLDPDKMKKRRLSGGQDTVDRNKGGKHEAGGGGEPSKPRRSIRGEEHSADGGKKRADHDRRGPIQDFERVDKNDAAERGTCQIDRVEPADLSRESRQSKTHGDAAEDEGDRDHHVRQRDQIETDDRAMDDERDAEVCQEARDDGEGEQQRAQREVLLRLLPREEAGEQVDEYGTHDHPEHRDRDRDERKVIPHRDTEDSREQNLVHQRRQHHHEETGVGAFRREELAVHPYNCLLSGIRPASRQR